MRDKRCPPFDCERKHLSQLVATFLSAHKTKAFSLTIFGNFDQYQFFPSTDIIFDWYWLQAICYCQAYKKWSLNSCDCRPVSCDRKSLRDVEFLDGFERNCTMDELSEFLNSIWIWLFSHFLKLSPFFERTFLSEPVKK